MTCSRRANRVTFGMEVGQCYNRRRRLARQPDRGEIALKEGGVKSDERTFDVNLMELCIRRTTPLLRVYRIWHRNS